MNGAVAHIETLVNEPGAIHRATEADYSFILDLAQKKYLGRVLPSSIEWFKWCCGSKNHLVLVGECSIGVAAVNWRYGSQPVARMELIAGLPKQGLALETLRMLKVMISWAKERGVKEDFRLDADTGVDFAPFAKRLGGHVVTLTQYRIPL